jgi:cysteinyl-tRNA synthetase
MIIGLIKSVLKSLELYLAFKNKAFHRDLLNDHREREKRLINEIEKLRASGGSNDADRADIIRDQLLTEKIQFQYLTELYASNETNAPPVNNGEPPL